MKDQYYREIDYARISITDQCNLQCKYCRNDNEIEDTRSLSFEQLKTIIDVLDTLKFRKIRFTGGEPLLNDKIIEILKYANNKPNIKDIGLTTNAILLDKYLDDLIAVGLKRINISLDSLDDEKYFTITGANYLHTVKSNIFKAKEKGLIIKVNVVLMKGVNDDEIADFLEFGRLNDIQVRFIELMPIGDNNEYINGKQISVIERFKGYKIREKKPNCKDVSDYFYDEYNYCFGVISPISNHFCNRCNRVRFTCDGKLRLCLHSDNDIDIVEYLSDRDKLLTILKQEIYNKPDRHHLDEDKISKRAMSKIGG